MGQFLVQILKKREGNHELILVKSFKHTWKRYFFDIWGMLSDSKDVVKFDSAKGMNFGWHVFLSFWAALGPVFGAQERRKSIPKRIQNVMQK